MGRMKAQVFEEGEAEWVVFRVEYDDRTPITELGCEPKEEWDEYKTHYPNETGVTLLAQGLTRAQAEGMVALTEEEPRNEI